MKVSVSLEVVKFKVPSSLPLRDRWGSILISNLSEKALSSLCDAFREEVFVKAGKRDPRLPAEEDDSDAHPSLKEDIEILLGLSSK